MNTQIVGNVGLYLVCYELSRRGWNVMPTARNARGVDIVAYDLKATRYIGVQVKALSKKNPVPLGNSLEKIMGDFWVIVNNLNATPNIFILKPEEVKQRAHRGEKDGQVSYWLQPSAYVLPEFLNRWDRIENLGPDYAPPIIEPSTQVRNDKNLAAHREVLFNETIIRELSSGTIEIEKNGSPVIPVKPELCEIAKMLGVDTLNKKGNERNTRQLGSAIIDTLSKK